MGIHEPELDVAAAAMVAEGARFVVVGGFSDVMRGGLSPLDYGLAEVHGELPHEPIPGLDN